MTMLAAVTEAFNHFIYITPLIILASSFLLVRLIRFSLNKYFINEAEKINTDPTNYVYLKNIISFLIYTIALFLIIYTIPTLKQLALTLFAGAGIIVAILGFASQQAFSNIISGLFIVIFKPYRVGDLIELDDKKIGEVLNITLRHTVINDFNNCRLIIPNSIISNVSVVNYEIDDNRICKFIEFELPYNCDIDRIKDILREITFENEFTDFENKEDIDIRVVEMGASTMKFRIYAWTLDPMSSWRMNHQINEATKKRFDNEGIEFPFPTQNVIVHQNQK